MIGFLARATRASQNTKKRRRQRVMAARELARVRATRRMCCETDEMRGCGCDSSARHRESSQEDDEGGDDDVDVDDAFEVGDEANDVFRPDALVAAGEDDEGDDEGNVDEDKEDRSADACGCNC